MELQSDNLETRETKRKRGNAIRELHSGYRETLQLCFVSRGADYQDKRGRRTQRGKFTILMCFITSEDTSVVDSTVSSSRLRTASVTMVS